MNTLQLGGTETTITCVFDPELPSRLLKGSTHSCKLASCDLSPFMPPPTVNHDCPDTVFEESRTADGSSREAATSVTAASPLLTFGSDGGSGSDLTPSYPTCEALACSMGDFRLDGSLSGPDCSSWNSNEGCAVTYVEGCQAAHETSGIWTCVCVKKKVAGEVVLEVVIPECSSLVGSLDDCQRVLATDGYDIPSQNGCAAKLCPWWEYIGNFRALPFVG